jgi:hypothetical protein
LLASAAAEALAREERESRAEPHEKAEEKKKKLRWGAPD